MFPNLVETRKGQISNGLICGQIDGGRGRDRTGDPLLAKQVLSQLSYTPTVGLPFILKHFRGIQNPFLRILTKWSEPLDRDN